ncbi:SDR family oxidoreductase [Metabacillus sp. GX 13764]|uniref:SDR family NAD(P)-dependent oxidoreductase n=1 Tax=Metabacillus kandeliae TaxID=2900151 RepID=UPI001E4212D9|nr:SDR family oxidoreductase [Metabacillus kandeliae]MCD7035257.1 SDR family oxidoreductase [Metabacillus kandeliae]
MDLKLQGKTALITGSTAGIGKGIAEELLKEGAHVIVNGRSGKRVDQTVSDLTHLGKVYGIAADLSKPDGSQNLIKQAEEIAEIDILINNLAFFEVKAFEEVTDEEWEDYFQVNIMSAVRMSRHFLPKMIKRNNGRLLNIASEAGIKPVPSMIPYSMTKTSLISLSRGLAELTKGTKVTVNAVLPGPTWTEGVENFLKGAAQAENKDLESYTMDYFKENEPSSLIQRFATIEEVASTVAFLASEKASAINGTSQRVEGGIIRSI